MGNLTSRQRGGVEVSVEGYMVRTKVDPIF